ncbi:MAG TPA: hypothetical protein VMV06_04250, partial [Acidimicrobiales bacterium]|nr:hypothetical protein [Acidimicrobiales bacterium]
MTRRSFASDNWSGIHPEVLAAITEANGAGTDGAGTDRAGTDRSDTSTHTPSYGADPVTAEAVRLLRRHFGEDAEVLFCFNGTGANVVGLQSLL